MIPAAAASGREPATSDVQNNSALRVRDRLAYDMGIPRYFRPGTCRRLAAVYTNR
jgi:hypothetical protein